MKVITKFVISFSVPILLLCGLLVQYILWGWSSFIVWHPLVHPLSRTLFILSVIWIALTSIVLLIYFRILKPAQKARAIGKEIQEVKPSIDVEPEKYMCDTCNRNFIIPDGLFFYGIACKTEQNERSGYLYTYYYDPVQIKWAFCSECFNKENKKIKKINIRVVIPVLSILILACVYLLCFVTGFKSDPSVFVYIALFFLIIFYTAVMILSYTNLEEELPKNVSENIDPFEDFYANKRPVIAKWVKNKFFKDSKIKIWVYTFEEYEKIIETSKNQKMKSSRPSIFEKIKEY